MCNVTSSQFQGFAQVVKHIDLSDLCMSGQWFDSYEVQFIRATPISVKTSNLSSSV